jgi:uncharacterized protein (DUF1015 family)
MAVIKPFRGLRYSSHHIPAMQTVVSQPYDRITAELQTQYYALSTYNIVHIIQGAMHDGDTLQTANEPNPYGRAKIYLQQWLDQSILQREDYSAFYVYEQTFSVNNTVYVRLGMIAAIELTEFDEGVILPHERTHSGPKEDRLRLLTTLQVNTEQVFLLYPDPQNRVNALLRSAIADREPNVDVVELFENAVRQRMWVVTDPDIQQAIQAHMAPMRNLIIADGHHRYETALTFRNQQRAAHPDAPPSAAFNFISATLVSMDDPGLVILPTHREICNFTRTTPAEILKRAAVQFTIQPATDLAACLAAINAHPTGYAFGFYGPTTGFHVLTLKDHGLTQECGTLAVSVLHRLLVEQAAEVPIEGIEDKTMIRYHRDPQAAVDNVDQGLGNFVFFLSPTRMENIKACAARGEKMPQKSTDFYPKVISGLAMMPVGPDECL